MVEARVHEAARAGYAAGAETYARALPSYPAEAVAATAEELPSIDASVASQFLRR